MSIALFNQASRITIFPLVSITTSFVAEEETIGEVGTKPAEKHSIERSKSKEVMPEVMLQDVEKGLSNQNADSLGKSLSADTEMKEPMPEGSALEKVEKDTTVRNDMNSENGTS